MSDVQLQPDTDDVLQEEPEEYESHTIAVCVESVKAPVRVQDLPRKAGSTRTKTIGTTTADRVLTADHFRATATILCADQAFRFAFTAAAASDDSTMALWPAALPLTVTCATDVWVKVDTAAAAVSIITERWAAGE